MCMLYLHVLIGRHPAWMCAPLSKWFIIYNNILKPTYIYIYTVYKNIVITITMYIYNTVVFHMVLPTVDASWVAQVLGMTCASCVGTVEKALKSSPGVADAQVNLLAETATVRQANWWNMMKSSLWKLDMYWYLVGGLELLFFSIYWE